MQMINDRGREEGLLRVQFERLATTLGIKLPALMEEIDGFVVERKTNEV